jgi:hypothetical protein
MTYNKICKILFFEKINLFTQNYLIIDIGSAKQLGAQIISLCAFCSQDACVSSTKSKNSELIFKCMIFWW